MNASVWVGFVKEEWLLFLSLLGTLSTSLYLHRFPGYSASDFETLSILFILFTLTAGLQKHQVLTKMAAGIERGRFIPAKLVLATFFFSRVVTNDVALLAVVPLTLALRVDRKEWLVILEALAANAGSALSPFGNPQNLFLYWFYQVPFSQFVKTIAPFSLLFLLLTLGGALLVDTRRSPSVRESSPDTVDLSPAAYFYVGALLVLLLVILRLLPFAVGWGVLLGVAILERGRLRADYALLVTFALFFGFTDNLRVLLAAVLVHPHHVFLLSSLLSQVISNVPAALLLADFTPRWQALLWGVSVGGFGNLIGSLANLITYRLYAQQEKKQARLFLLKFHVTSYVAFFIGWAAYFLDVRIAS